VSTDLTSKSSFKSQQSVSAVQLKDETQNETQLEEVTLLSVDLKSRDRTGVAVVNEGFASKQDTRHDNNTSNVDSSHIVEVNTETTVDPETLQSEASILSMMTSVTTDDRLLMTEKSFPPTTLSSSESEEVLENNETDITGNDRYTAYIESTKSSIESFTASAEPSTFLEETTALIIKTGGADTSTGTGTDSTEKNVDITETTTGTRSALEEGPETRVLDESINKLSGTGYSTATGFSIKKPAAVHEESSESTTGTTSEDTIVFIKKESTIIDEATIVNEHASTGVFNELTTAINIFGEENLSEQTTGTSEKLLSNEIDGADFDVDKSRTDLNLLQEETKSVFKMVKPALDMDVMVTPTPEAATTIDQDVTVQEMSTFDNVEENSTIFLDYISSTERNADVIEEVKTTESSLDSSTVISEESTSSVDKAFTAARDNPSSTVSNSVNEISEVNENHWYSTLAPVENVSTTDAEDTGVTTALNVPEREEEKAADVKTTTERPLCMSDYCQAIASLYQPDVR
jgi:hypothetical protein